MNTNVIKTSSSFVSRFSSVLLCALKLAIPLSLARANTDDTNYIKINTSGTAHASGTESIAIGSGTASGTGAISIGGKARATRDGATALGYEAWATGTNATAIGNNAGATANYATALGAWAKATQVGATAVGNSASAGADRATALGYFANAGGLGATALGYYASAAGYGAIAIGHYAKADYSYATTIGDEAQATADYAIALGSYSVANRAALTTSGAGFGALSIGTSGTTRQLINLARGTGNTDAVNVSQLLQTATFFGGGAGFNATTGLLTSPTYTISSTNYSDVGKAIAALDAKIGDSTGIFRHDDVTGDIAIASQFSGTLVDFSSSANARRLTGVAPGRVAADSLDAINGAQLYTTNTTLEALSGTVGNINTTVTNISGSITNIYNTATSLQHDALLWDNGSNAFVASHGGVLSNKITGVAAGALTADSLDAVNGSQLYTTNTTLGALSGTVSNISTTINNLSNGGAGIFRHDEATGDITIGTQFSGTLVDFSSSSAAARRLTGVAPGRVAADSLDAINGTQLHTLGTSVAGALGGDATYIDGTFTGPTYVFAGGTYYNVGDVVTSISGTITNIYNTATSLQHDALLWDKDSNAFVASHGGSPSNKITGVAAGDLTADSLDAVNGAQLYTTNTTLGALSGTVSNINTTITTIGDSLTLIDNTLISLGGTVSNINTTINNITNGSAGLVRQDSATGNISIGAHVSGTILDIAGTDGHRRITGVAAAIEDTDAVNFGQLKAAGLVTGTGAEAALANALVYDDSTRSAATLGGTLASGTGANMTGGTRLTNVALAALHAASTDAVNGSQLYDTNLRVEKLEAAVALMTGDINRADANPHFTTGADDTGILAVAPGGRAVAAGMGATASGASSTAVGAFAKASAANATAIGQGSETQASNGTALGANAIVLAAATNAVALGASSVADEPDTVSFGSDTLKRRLTNVAAGVRAYDAVNMSQLWDFQNDVNDRFGKVASAINRLDERIDSVGAMATALSQVQPRLSPQANRSQLALGVGVYRHRGAFAMGYGYTSRRGDRGVQASFALGDNGEITGGGGVIFGW